MDFFCGGGEEGGGGGRLDSIACGLGYADMYLIVCSQIDREL